jgi:hypothetical protein
VSGVTPQVRDYRDWMARAGSAARERELARVQPRSRRSGWKLVAEIPVDRPRFHGDRVMWVGWSFDVDVVGFDVCVSEYVSLTTRRRGQG